ncbi:MAG: CmcI family methyltransferase [Waterburya sp.]
MSSLDNLLDYRIAISETQKKYGLTNPQRFVKISEREDRSDLSMSMWEHLLTKTFLQTWKDILISKGVFELSAYPMLIKELQPQTIIELGALSGGSAVWFTDLLETFKIQGTVYSVDVDLSLLDDKAKADSRINWIEGDCNNISAIFSPDLLSRLPHPWLIVEDCHVNLLGILEYFHNNGLQPGDYWIVEDTNKMVPEYWMSRWEDTSELKQVEQKLDTIRDWLKDREDEYLVDTYYLDMYGYNVSKNWNSVLKKV